MEYMEWFVDNILFLPFLVGAIFMITSVVTYLFPPKKINYLYGYRTASSMKSQQRWDFAQRYATTKMLQVGAFLFAVSFLGIFLQVDDNTNVAIGLVLMLPSCAFLLLSTERALRKKFPNE
jgi:uncharacterized membrane protein